MTSKKTYLDRFIENRFDGYKHQLNQIDSSLHIKTKDTKSIAIVGAGIAGSTAAVYLADKGFNVDLYEKDNFLGGKVGSWNVTFSDGYKTNVEHGFHAFFRQYYNLKNLLKKINADKFLIPINDYLIKTLKYGDFSFKNIKTAPLKNILSLRKEKVYRLKDALLNKNFSKMLVLMKYNRDKTFEHYDSLSFEEFANRAKLPAEMRLMFTTFSRAFFAEPQYISMAELIKSFHFYFLSNDHGLVYDVLNDDFENTLWKPASKYLTDNSVRIFLNSPIEKIDKIEDGKFVIKNREYDYLILSSDIPGTQKIILNSSLVKEKYPGFYNQIGKQKISQRYAVLRIWIDKDISDDLPFFVFTDAIKILDSVTIYHKMEISSSEWVVKNGGGIFELHSYALPDSINDEQAVRDQLLLEFETYFPEIKGYKILYENLQVRDDFTAFHVNLFKDRPGVKTEIKNLYLSGDWVKLDCPAMLMEAAATSALYAVNEILKSESLREEPVFSVPLKGIFA